MRRMGTMGAVAAAVLVSAAAYAAAPANRYSYLDSNNIVVDNVTGLKWQRTIPTTNVTYPAALSACDALVLGGLTAWRLPEVKELASLVDLAAESGPTIDAVAFPSAPNNLHWTGTPYVGATDNYWVVNFSDGGISFALRSSAYRYRCVHD